jgi:putative multiple sugar transport system substrate-binding protein
MRTPIKSLLAVSAVAALALTGCGRSDSSTTATSGAAGAAAGAGTLIGVALPQKTSENWVLAEQLFKDGLTAAGYKGDVQFANGGVSEQQNQIQSMVTKGAKVIVVGAIDGSQLGTQLKAAKDGGATVIAYDRLIKNTADVDYYVAYDNFKVGVLQGRPSSTGSRPRSRMAPTTSSCSPVRLTTPTPRSSSTAPWSVLKPKIADGTLKVASGQKDFNQAVTQGWKAENAQKRMDTLLVGLLPATDLDGVLSPNDTLARAILTSVKASGKASPVVTGQDSEVESVKSIMAGEQYSTINKDTRNLVKATIEMVTAIVKGGKPTVNDEKSYNNGVKVVPANLLAPVIVTKANAKEAYANDPTESQHERRTDRSRGPSPGPPRDQSGRPRGSRRPSRWRLRLAGAGQRGRPRSPGRDLDHLPDDPHRGP